MTEEDLNNLGKIAERQKNQRANKFKNRVLKETHDIKLAENLCPITKKLSELIESTKKIGELVKTSDVEDEITQTIATKIITTIQSIRDILSLTNRSKSFSNLEEN